MTCLIETDSLTSLLHSWREGSGTAFGTLVDRVYDQLDAIVLRATRHAQAERYPTVSALTADIRRFLAQAALKERDRALLECPAGSPR